MKTDEFFIGYEPPMPPRLARFVVTVVIVLTGAVAAWAVTLASGHVALEGGTFEFGHPRRVAGTIIERPYPALQLDGVDQNESPRRQVERGVVSGFTGSARTVPKTITRTRRHGPAVTAVVSRAPGQVNG